MNLAGLFKNSRAMLIRLKVDSSFVNIPPVTRLIVTCDAAISRTNSVRRIYQRSAGNRAALLYSLLTNCTQPSPAALKQGEVCLFLNDYDIR